MAIKQADGCDAWAAIFNLYDAVGESLNVKDHYARAKFVHRAEQAFLQQTARLPKSTVVLAALLHYDHRTALRVKWLLRERAEDGK